MEAYECIPDVYGINLVPQFLKNLWSIPIMTLGKRDNSLLGDSRNQGLVLPRQIVSTLLLDGVLLWRSEIVHVFFDDKLWWSVSSGKKKKSVFG